MGVAIMELLTAAAGITVALLPLAAIMVVAILGPDAIDAACDLVEMLKAKRRDGEW